MYLGLCTRPDILHAVVKLSQFNNSYSMQHWQYLMRILRYLKGSQDFCLQFQKSAMKNDLIGFADADWGNDPVDRKSYSGYCSKLDECPISWSSKKHKCVSLSSAEAEYVSLTAAAKEAVFLRRLFIELTRCVTLEPTIIYNDSQSAQKMAHNPVFHDRTKHIDIQFHFIRDSIKDKKVIVKYQCTKDMPADFLTKPVPKDKHVFCRTELKLSV